MKRILALLLACSVAVASFAQTETKNKEKVKPTSTLGEKVHNTFHKHKRHNGYKIKHKEKVVKK